ncbi:hypothetical protein SAY87_030337 [Trapa incisa]|uniref:Uncharacterized protein n=1 Tax=Trapa incisa TaxID=236973 RepID=A0AAN7QMY9_9MYRT|nr:hypothetical protein SAY87_030337 [Trapa incisa]
MLPSFKFCVQHRSAMCPSSVRGTDYDTSRSSDEIEHVPLLTMVVVVVISPENPTFLRCSFSTDTRKGATSFKSCICREDEDDGDDDDDDDDDDASTVAPAA